MAQEKPKFQPLRSLGVLEKYLVKRSRIGVYQKVAITARYRCRNIKTLRPALFAALAAVISKHPSLSVTSVDVDSGVPYFARLPIIDLDKIITFTEFDELADQHGRFPALDALLAHEHTQAWEYMSLPLWRMHVLQNRGNFSEFILCYFFHHCIGDTKSALVLHQAVETALNDSLEREPVSVVDTPDLPLLPPLEALRGLAERNGSENQEQSLHIWSGAVQHLPVQTKVTSLWLSQEETTGLLQVSKYHGVSLTATLEAMLVAALFTHVPPDYTTIKSDCAVSLRQWLPNPINADSMGVFVDTFFMTHERAPFTWEEARRIKNRIDQVMQEKGGDGLLEKLSRIADFESWMKGKMGRRRTTSLELSNVGHLGPSQADKDYQIESLLFSQSAGASSGAIKVSAVSGRDGRLTLGFSWQEGVVENQVVQDVVREFHRILDDQI
ncbi:uncharacterized protein A1O5_11005 [Cladophialophora psammophila CBS 110553]|uniref:Alcohol acetyltransferase n=1 Tax=Cladophialophora psammophila CBS 110553 TaxID=1182543 RepID=W9X5P6_9EURO|nr:uncharacterized protein A1O5_11005 [Cladophialophora psammophila CBS 110553]EXJ65764.1 hypothetical protein A1O5_11005 [Cladophialophora psammophila CBS 110553]